MVFGIEKDYLYICETLCKMNRYLPHSPLIPCFSPKFLMGGGRHNGLDNRLNSSNIYSYTEMMCLADETQISSAIFCVYLLFSAQRKYPSDDTRFALSLPLRGPLPFMRTSVRRPGRVFAITKYGKAKRPPGVATVVADKGTGSPIISGKPSEKHISFR